MSVVVNHFQTLCERFPEWADLQAYLTSNEGGNLRIVESEDVPTRRVIRYVKGVSNLRNVALGVGLFRSVVWDTVTNRPLCFAPPKSSEGPPPLNVALASVEEFVDGVMIQAYVMASNPTVLQLATRSQIGAINSFYSSTTFGKMFEEALAATPVRTKDALLMHLREHMDTNAGTSAFASFVVQHPEHRIVAKTVTPDLHMIHLGVVLPSGCINLAEQATEWAPALRRLQVPRYPIKMFRSTEEVGDLMRRTAVQNGFRWQGLVFKDGTGARWRMRSASYTMLRTLRGAEASADERFLRLRRDGKVKEYLKHFSEERDALWDLETTLRARTADALSAYNAVHKGHLMKFADLPVCYKPVVHLLHVEYLGALRPLKQSVQLSNVINVVNGLKNFEQKRLMAGSAFVAPEAPEA